MKNKIFKISKLIGELTLLIAISAIAIQLFGETALAYQIDASYRPTNAPFSLNSELADTRELGGLTPAARATILILQILSGTLLYFAGPIAIVMIIINGFNLIRGGSDPENVTNFKKNLQFLIGGLILIILSYSIVRFIIELTIKAAEVSS